MLNEMQRRRPPGLVLPHKQPLRPASPPPGIARGAEANSGFKETKDAATPNASGERPRDPRGDDADASSSESGSSSSGSSSSDSDSDSEADRREFELVPLDPEGPRRKAAYEP